MTTPEKGIDTLQDELCYLLERLSELASEKGKGGLRNQAIDMVAKLKALKPKI